MVSTIDVMTVFSVEMTGRVVLTVFVKLIVLVDATLPGLVMVVVTVTVLPACPPRVLVKRLVTLPDCVVVTVLTGPGNEEAELDRVTSTVLVNWSVFVAFAVAVTTNELVDWIVTVDVCVLEGLMYDEQNLLASWDPDDDSSDIAKASFVQNPACLNRAVGTGETKAAILA